MKKLLTLTLLLVAISAIGQTKTKDGGSLAAYPPEVNQTTYRSIDTTVSFYDLALAVKYILNERDWNKKAADYMVLYGKTRDCKYQLLCQSALDSSAYYDNKFKALHVK